MQILTSLSRRRFLTGAAATAALNPSRPKAALAHSRQNLAFFGDGKLAYSVMDHALRQAGVRIVAVCETKAKEVVEKHYAEAKAATSRKPRDTWKYL